MKLTPISICINDFPAEFHPLLSGAKVYDSSCSPEAKVWFIGRDGGYFLKSAPAGRLKTEAKMTRYFASLGLGATVLSYLSLCRDWLLTTAVQGSDCTHAPYIENPLRLSDLLGQTLRALHEIKPLDCPVPNRTEVYLQTAKDNFLKGQYDTSLSPNKICPTAAESWRMVEEGASLLTCDTLLHGDYCLPNIMLNNWQLSGFIDLDGAGVGDRHIDLFWGVWTLQFNLHTDSYGDRFLDAYGRDKVDKDCLELIEIIERFG